MFRPHDLITCIFCADRLAIHDPELLLDLSLCLLRLIALHPPCLPQHLQSEQEHDGGAGVVRDLKHLNYKLIPINVVLPTSRGIKVVTTHPSNADRMVIRYRADRAAMNTISLLFLMARMAAMKNVLSPISDTRITVMEEAGMRSKL